MLNILVSKYRIDYSEVEEVWHHEEPSLNYCSMETLFKIKWKMPRKVKSNSMIR